LLALAGLVLLAWARWFGIALPPVKRPVPLISVVGLPAALACGLGSYVCLMVRREVRAGQSGAALAYLALVPVAVAVLAAILSLVP
jgi:hypothetical protein